MKSDEIKLPEVIVNVSQDSEIDYTMSYENLKYTRKFKMTPAEISCSTIQMSGIDDFYGIYISILKTFTLHLQQKLSPKILSPIKEAKDKFRQLCIDKLRTAMSQITDEKIVLFSTTINDRDRETFFDSVSDFVAVEPVVNPNTDNIIKIWGFITDAEYTRRR